MVCSGVNLFYLYGSGSTAYPEISGCVFLIRSVKLSAIVYVNPVSPALSLSCPSGAHIRCIMCFVFPCSVWVCAQSLSCDPLFATAWTVARQAPLSMEFSKPENWSGLPVPPSRGSSWSRDPTQVSGVSCIGRQTLYRLATWDAPLCVMPWTFLSDLLSVWLFVLLLERFLQIHLLFCP